MRKDVILCLGDSSLQACQSPCINIVGRGFNLKRLALICCPYMDESFVNGHIRELWFYRGVLVFQDCDSWRSFVVPELAVCRFFSLRDAKIAVSRFLNKKGVFAK